MAKKKTYSQAEIDNKAIEIVREEKNKWENATCFVTERVAFQMRYLIRTLRKNYWSIYDYPIDPTTRREKTWIPLTESMVEEVVTNTKIDTKDINFRSKNPEGYEFTQLTRSVVKDYLDNHYFGQQLDETTRNLAIDGTAVWKTFKGKGGDLVTKHVDLLNCYIDPTEDNIQSAYRFTERALMLPSEIEAMDWRNNKEIEGSKGMARVDSAYQTISTGTTAEYSDVWETWGKIPQWMITRKMGDDKEIDGRIIVSGLEAVSPRAHLIETNDTKDLTGKIIKPYEEVRYTKISNRWYGKGIAEKLMWLQIWLNTIVNIRINRSFVSQLGLFKIKRGANITPQMIGRLAANGAILVNDQGDIEQMQMQEASQASYTDEENIKQWAQRQTSVYNSPGETLPASTPATNAVLNDRNAKSKFGDIKDTIGNFIERWIDRHALPILAKTVKKGDLIRFSVEDDNFKEIVQKVVVNEAMKKLEELYERGYQPEDTEIMAEIQRTEDSLRKRPELFVKLEREILAEHLYTKVYVTNEEMDVAVTVQNLLQSNAIDPSYSEAIIKEVFDLMGLAEPKKNPAPPMPPGMSPGQPGQPMGGQPPTAQSLTTAATVPQMGQRVT